MNADRSGMRLSSPPDVRNISDDRIHLEDRTSRLANFETTHDGDVVIVQPSFDDESHKSLYSSPLRQRQEWQARSPQQEKTLQVDSEARSPSSPPVRGHARNLSSAFFDATSLGRRGSDDSADMYKDEESRKHRRMTSNGTSNPNMAHRRLNSVGNSALVSRNKHHRETSFGLDMLSAAVDATEEEIALAVGKQEPSQLAEFQAPEVPQNRSFEEQPPYPPSTSHNMYPPQNRRFSGGPSPFSHGGHPFANYSSPQAPCYYPPYARGMGYPSQPPYPTQHSMYPPPPKPMTQYPPGDPPRANMPEAVQSGKGWANPAANHQGSQTFVTAVAVGGNRTLRPSKSQRNAATNTDSGIPKHIDSHHRRLSSFSSLGLSTIFCNPVSSPAQDREHPLKSSKSKKHHRTTSSSVSFLNVLDVAGMDDNADETFLRHLHGAADSNYPASTSGSSSVPMSSTASIEHQSVEKQPKKLASGGTSKRVRRKCTVAGCPNRVVQGGLCISHGAKRKTCKHPGCTKNVKKAGLCSTHGPARRRCDIPDCPKVAVQGGRCIAHGAKKKLCSYPDCTKQAILGGMCKKHHDAEKAQNEEDPSQAPASSRGHGPIHRPTHTRGLSIFHDISADAVQSLINAETVSTSSDNPPPQEGPAGRSW